MALASLFVARKTFPATFSRSFFSACPRRKRLCTAADLGCTLLPPAPPPQALAYPGNLNQEEWELTGVQNPPVPCPCPCLPRMLPLSVPLSLPGCWRITSDGQLSIVSSSATPPQPHPISLESLGQPSVPPSIEDSRGSGLGVFILLFCIGRGIT